jgi:hypothetical protein
MNKEINMVEAAKLFMGDTYDEIYEEEVIEEFSLWGKQHCIVMKNFANNILFGEPLIAEGVEGINGLRLANVINLSGWLKRSVDDNLYLELLNEHIRNENLYPEKK